MASVPTIFQLNIERFRGLKKLEWRPGPGVNLILGGGDAGKTTILDAIALLLSPTNATVVADTDYHGRQDEAGFLIEAVVSLPPDSGIDYQTKTAWPWSWDGTKAVVPQAGGGSATKAAVYKLRVRGTDELELAYEIAQPDGSTDHLPVGLRRAIGVIRLSGDDRNDRDLRLVHGSALDRLIADKALRSKIASEVAKSTVNTALSKEAAAALRALDESFQIKKLPHGLDISMTGGQGASVASLVGLTAKREEVALPLASWGSGTRRLAALAITEQHQGDFPVTIVDEVERGLEPYRQRVLIQKLQTGKSQAFITTHSPTVLAAADKARVWYVDHRGQIGQIDGKKVDAHRAHDPETFLARLSVVGEGVTEVGFVRALLTRSLGSDLLLHGLHVTDGRGHDTVLGIMEALLEGGLSFAGFVDSEGRWDNSWKAIGERLGTLLFRWADGDLESNVIAALEDDQLEQLLIHPFNADLTRDRLHSLAERLGIVEKDFVIIKAAAGAGLRQLVLDAAHGVVPEDKVDDEDKKKFRSHARRWFKSLDGGRELEGKVFGLGLWPKLQGRLLPFCNGVRAALGMKELDTLPS